MNKENETKIWKIRTIKNYPDAHNHLLLGKVLEITDAYVRIHCRTYHFGKAINRPEDIQVGDLMTRVVPWSRVEIINEMPSTFDYIKNTLITNKEGEVLFQDGRHTSHVGSGTKYEVRY
jgi:hypothetical protein